MLYSKSFIFTLREDPKVADCTSQKLLLKGCYLQMVSSGIYSYLPLGWRVLQKISDIIRKHMNASGACELLMSHLQPLELWKKTGRDKDLAEVMFKFKDKRKKELCLGPTHEEEITDIVCKFVSSYTHLPLILYQIQAKFRDETRPRFGLIRSSEFIMKDAYSFDVDEKGLDINYKKMHHAYEAIFKECGLNFVITEADPGVMGGNISHEFMVPAQIGEDILFYCRNCDKHFMKVELCPQCGGSLEAKKMIEVGHIFKLGTKYSQVQGAFFLDAKGRRNPIVMGCYGIGVSRLLPAIVETNSDEKGIIWPKRVSPFDAIILILDNSLNSQAMQLADTLQGEAFEILVDDREEPAGVKFNDAMLLGIPHLMIMGKNYINNKKIDVELRGIKEKLSLGKEEIVNFLKTAYRIKN